MAPNPLPLHFRIPSAKDWNPFVRRHGTPQQLALRARMVLAAAAGANNCQIARQLGVSLDLVRRWRERWRVLQPATLDDLPIADRLTDAPRPGAPRRITAEQECQIVALACESPSASERPISQWTSRGDCRRNPAARHRQPDFGAPCGAPVKKGALANLTLIRYWLTPAYEEQFDAKVTDICTVYRDAPALGGPGRTHCEHG